jgi:uncharacterized protein (DUF58 family)
VPTSFDPAFLRRLERLSIVARRALRGLARGERRSQRRGGTIEFADYRTYVPGDDVRAIDWHAYARLEALFLKVFVAEQELALHLLVDSSPSMRTGSPAKLEHALRIAAALGYIALSSGDRLSVRPFVAGESRDALGPLRGTRSFARLLAYLERAGRDQQGGRTSLGAAALAFLSRRPQRGVVVILSDGFDPEGAGRALGLLRAGSHEPFFLHVASPDDVELARGAELDLVDAETGEVVSVMADRAAVAAHDRCFREFVHEIERHAARHECGYAFARTDVPFEELVLELCRRRVIAR